MVRIGRPKLSSAMRTRFEAIEHEEKEKDLAEQKKLTEKVKLEAQLQRAKMLSTQAQEESRIQMETKVLAAKKQAEIQEIQNAMQLKRAQTTAESHLVQKKREADGLRATIGPSTALPRCSSGIGIRHTGRAPTRYTISR